MTTIALIVAAGRGTRADDGTADVPKQYRALAGEPVLRHTLRTFANHPAVDAVLAVIHADDSDRFAKASQGLAKVLPPVPGGASRQESVRLGLESLNKIQPNTVLIHDGARPLVSGGLIDAVIANVASETAVLPVLRVSDTLRRVDQTGKPGELVSRDGLIAAQTPQGFNYAEIVDAHRAAHQANLQFTDDIAVAQWKGSDIVAVDGDFSNIKITTPGDFKVAETLVRGREMRQIQQIRTGLGFDVHAFGTGNEVVICGIAIPHDKGLDGHSDADVGLHALTDALLGAMGKDDIGAHFPPSDPQWAGADSSQFLAHAADLVAAGNGRINHVDVTIICQAPKIGPHREAMRMRIADILELSIDQVNVKATTTEKLGFTGRGEGIAAQAIATVSVS